MARESRPGRRIPGESHQVRPFCDLVRCISRLPRELCKAPPEVKQTWTSLLTVAIHTAGYGNDYRTLLIIDTP
jgi:hypothetical protein